MDFPLSYADTDNTTTHHECRITVITIHLAKLPKGCLRHIPLGQSNNKDQIPQSPFSEKGERGGFVILKVYARQRSSKISR